jgi:hypothetical protein
MSRATPAAALGKQQPIEIRLDLVKVGGDVIVGILLSRIVFWHEPKGIRRSTRHVFRDGVLWIAKTQAEWMAECHISRKQYRRAITVLKKKGLVEVRVMKFDGVTMIHTRLLRDNLQTQLNQVLRAASKP